MWRRGLGWGDELDVPMLLQHPTGRPNYSILRHLGRGAIVFSYETPVAVRPFVTVDPEDTNRWHVSVNEWSTTTGKHLNMIDGGDKSSRRPHSVICRLIEEMYGDIRERPPVTEYELKQAAQIAERELRKMSRKLS